MPTGNRKRQKPGPEFLGPAGADFNRPPLLTGEDPLEYQRLLERVLAAIKPIDAIEEILTRDAVDLIWDSVRLRRLKVSYLDSMMHKGLEEALALVVPISDAVKLARGWRQNLARKNTEQILEQTGLSLDSAVAHTLVAHINTVDTLDRMAATADTRRNSALREIERHRETLGLRLRQEAEKIEGDEKAFPGMALVGKQA